ncbi:helix-turn-helix transcriptional regulator [Natrinema soli]|uniref:Helix-turn-helix transcriptional regulator n=1 Tax=Natrinema soli TaxID=1930624 RepID=A0ABD5SQJ0_9EURY|nr:helix-turn-helix domain-containing protein [Natrinema soli]
MVSNPQIGVGAQLASIHSTVSIGTGPASTHQGAHAIPSGAIFSGASDQPDGPLSMIQLLRVSSFWETALIAVLFLLISVLIGIRMGDVLSKRELEMSSLPFVVNAAGETDEVHTHTDDQWASESYLSPETPPKLLSDEGKVVRLLVANDGRIRQHQIADETGWSKSKVSRICSQMHADGTIEKRSVGRENVIVFSEPLPDDETRSTEIGNPHP